MILVYIQAMLGTWGSAVLQFYMAYSLWINLLIVVYGIWIIFAWSNLKRIRHTLIWSLVSQINQQQPKPVPGKPGKKQEPDLDIPWQSTVAGVRFPFVAKQFAFWPRYLSVDSIQQMLPAKDLITEAKRIVILRNRKKPVRKGKDVASI